MPRIQILIVRGLVAMLLLCSGLAAHASAKPATPVPLLWKACDRDNCAYLLGSFHLLRPSDYPLPREVEAAFADSDAAVFEIAPDALQKGAGLFGAAGLRTDGTTLDDGLTPALRAKLAAWLRRNSASLQAQGFPPEAMQRLHAWYAAVIIDLQSMRAAGLDPRLGLDDHFMAAASQRHMAAEGLESVADQVALFSTMSADEQRQFLAESLDDAGHGTRDVEALHATWRAGDADRLWANDGRKMLRAYPRLYRTIVADRNARWVPEIGTMLARSGTGNIFIVVGAMHLVGPDGVVEKLKSAGYRVERICDACTTAPH